MNAHTLLLKGFLYSFGFSCGNGFSKGIWMNKAWISLLTLIIFSSPLQGIESLPSGFLKSVKALGQPLTPYVVVVAIDDQTLTLFKNKRLISSYKISTSKYGPGQLVNTLKTPVGLHRVAQKIGAENPLGTIYYSRISSGRKCKPNDENYEQEDLVLTRILWLEGLERGFNLGKNKRGQCIDSFERYIYIHGTNHEEKLGRPYSHGCVRMSSKDIADLYEKIPEGTLVWISAGV
jgi:hypothetical protein